MFKANNELSNFDENVLKNEIRLFNSLATAAPLFIADLTGTNKVHTQNAGSFGMPAHK